jgi:hypothetical protein
MSLKWTAKMKLPYAELAARFPESEGSAAMLNGSQTHSRIVVKI